MIVPGTYLRFANVAVSARYMPVQQNAVVIEKDIVPVVVRLTIFKRESVCDGLSSLFLYILHLYIIFLVS